MTKQRMLLAAFLFVTSGLASCTRTDFKVEPWMENIDQAARTTPDVVATCLRDARCTKRFIIGHGAECKGTPENSLAGIGCAARAAPIIEVDARLTADGIPVLLHDETLDRTTNCEGEVSSQTVEQLGQCHLANGEPVPTLQQATEACRDRCVLFLDLKAIGAGARITEDYRDVAEAGLFIYYAMTPDVASDLVATKQRVPSIITATLLENDQRISDLLAEFAGMLPTIVEVPFWSSARRVHQLQDRGVKVEIDVTDLQWLPRSLASWFFPSLTAGAQLVGGDDPQTFADLLG